MGQADILSSEKVSEARSLVNQKVEESFERLPSDQSYLNSSIKEKVVSIAEKGKRVRPLLAYLEAKAMGTEATDEELAELMSSLEWEHIRSKILDDIQDDSETRNDEDTVHQKMAEELEDRSKADHLVTNYIFATRDVNTSIISESGCLDDNQRTRLYQSISKAQKTLSLAQNRDLTGYEANRKIEEEVEREEWSQEDFTESIRARLDSDSKKTGALFGLIYDYVQEASYREDDNLRRFNELIGQGFQIVDDILDITAEEGEMGKDRLEDVDQGVRTIPIQIAERYLHTCPDEGRESEFNELGKELTEIVEGENSDIERGREIIVEKTPAIQASRNMAESYLNQALEFYEEVEFENQEYAAAVKDIAIYGAREREH